MNRALELACVIFMTPEGLEEMSNGRKKIKKHLRTPKYKRRKRTRWKSKSKTR